MKMPGRGPLRTLRANKWRYISLGAGFLLFVEPAAFFTKLLYWAAGNKAAVTLHSVCYRMPVDWIFSVRWPMLLGSIAALFVLTVIGLSYFLGPVFCGWLCPVGAASEAVSRATPLPDRFRIRIRDTGVVSSMRWGFLVGFAVLSILIGQRIGTAWLASICCRFCASAVLQNIAAACAGDADALGYWHSGSILVLVAWLGLGGVFLSGGRGWCLFFCPLGALANVAHWLGARRGWLATRFHSARCSDCRECLVTCPAQALKPDRSVATSLCINCLECTHACAPGAYECFVSNRGGWFARLLRRSQKRPLNEPEAL